MTSPSPCPMSTPVATFDMDSQSAQATNRQPSYDIPKIDTDTPQPYVPIIHSYSSSGSRTRDTLRNPKGPQMDRAKVPKGERYTTIDERCIVCLSYYELFPALPPTSSCAHPSQVCRSCLVQAIETAVEGGNPRDDLICPTLDCRKVLSYSDVQTWTQGHEDVTVKLLFERWDS